MAHMSIHLIILLLLQSSNASTHTSKPFQSPFNDITHSLKSRHLLENCSATVPLPGHTGTYSLEGWVRGYYFQAPTNFAITGISVPTDASSDSTTAAIIRFTNGPPRVPPSTTNDFTQVGYWKQSALSTIPTGCICVESGQYIGILGYRGTTNSYGDGPYNSNIDGYSVTFTRLQMQYSLISYTPRDVYTVGGPIGRVHFTYTVCWDTCNCLTPQPTQAPTTPSISPTQPSISPTLLPSISPTLLPSIAPSDASPIDKSINVTETNGSNITVITIIVVMIVIILIMCILFFYFKQCRKTTNKDNLEPNMNNIEVEEIIQITPTDSDNDIVAVTNTTDMCTTQNLDANNEDEVNETEKQNELQKINVNENNENVSESVDVTNCVAFEEYKHEVPSAPVDNIENENDKHMAMETKGMKFEEYKSMAPSVPMNDNENVNEIEDDNNDDNNVTNYNCNGEEGNDDGNEGMSNQHLEIKNWFDNVKLNDNDEYFHVFIQNGFDSMRLIKNITDDDLIQIGVNKLGHRKEILTQIKLL